MVALSMILLENVVDLDAIAILNRLQNHWGISECKLSDAPPDDHKDAKEIKNNLYMEIEGRICFVIPIDAPIPDEDVEFAMQISHLWLDAKEYVSRSHAHLIVGVMSPFDREITALDQHLILTKLVESVLHPLPQALGVYQGDATLIISPDFYKEQAATILKGQIPETLWVYFGLRIPEEGSANAYTYGLYKFGKNEMEILNSRKSGEEIMNFLMSISAYVIGADVTLKHGETCGFSATQRVPITLSKAVWLGGDADDTLKLDYDYNQPPRKSSWKFWKKN